MEHVPRFLGGGCRGHAAPRMPPGVQRPAWCARRITASRCSARAADMCAHARRHAHVFICAAPRFAGAGAWDTSGVTAMSKAAREANRDIGDWVFARSLRSLAATFHKDTVIGGAASRAGKLFDLGLCTRTSAPLVTNMMRPPFNGDQLGRHDAAGTPGEAFAPAYMTSRLGVLYTMFRGAGASSTRTLARARPFGSPTGEISSRPRSQKTAFTRHRGGHHGKRNTGSSEHRRL